MKKHNFSAGPCILPQEVFKEASEAILNYNGSGLSVIEISHRSKDFVDIMEEARSLALDYNLKQDTSTQVAGAKKRLKKQRCLEK